MQSGAARATLAAVPHDDPDGAGATIVSASTLVSEDAAARWREEQEEEAATDVVVPPLGPSKGRLLVVEAQGQSLTGVILRHAGYEVQHVDDGVTASQWLASSAFDAVLTDVLTTGINGIELLRYAHEHDPGLPVLLMTGEPDFDAAQQAVEHGAFQFLLKPIPADRVTAAVEKAVSARKLERARREALQLLEDLDTVVTEPTGDQLRFDRALRSLWMAYQPIVRTDGTLFAYEALVRSEEAGLSSAGDILDAAERLQRLTDLGRSVRARAGRVLEDGGGGWNLFVNLHAHDLLDETLVSPTSPLARIASHVVLEITERAALHDAGEARARMADLRALGFRIALDDLGAGYAGLTSFALLQPEVVKLDMGLVRGVDTDPVRRKLIGSVTALSRDMGIMVVGEGVETAAERDVLVELGCDLLQGYLFGKPQRM